MLKTRNLNRKDAKDAKEGKVYGFLWARKRSAVSFREEGVLFLS